MIGREDMLALGKCPILDVYQDSGVIDHSIFHECEDVDVEKHAGKQAFPRSDSRNKKAVKFHSQAGLRAAAVALS